MHSCSACASTSNFSKPQMCIIFLENMENHLLLILSIEVKVIVILLTSLLAFATKHSSVFSNASFKANVGSVSMFLFLAR